METLDSDLLRTFLAVARAGSISEGAERIHRSQSATSIQIQRLEAILGQPVFNRHGRGVVLSKVGLQLMPVAQVVTSRLDSAYRDISNSTVTGKLHLGIPDDYGREKLTKIIAQFSREHPGVELEVTCTNSARFPEALMEAELDLAIYEVSEPAADEELLAENPTCWVAGIHSEFSAEPKLPVALFDHTCWWREAAIASLEKRGKPYRIVYSSQSVSGVMAAIKAGIAVGLIGRSSITPDLTIIDKSCGFIPTPTSKLVMAAAKNSGGDPINTMKATLRDAFLYGP